MNRIALPLASLSLVLAACSQQPADQAPAGEATAENATAAATGSAMQPAGASASGAAVSEEPAKTIPLAIQGRWGLVPADCTSTRGDAKGLLSIDATTLKFYEARGTLGEIKERSDTRLRAAFAYSGEGMTWSRDEVLDVQDDGRTLVRREYGEDAAPQPFKYARCPA